MPNLTGRFILLKDDSVGYVILENVNYFLLLTKKRFDFPTRNIRAIDRYDRYLLNSKIKAYNGYCKNNEKYIYSIPYYMKKDLVNHVVNGNSEKKLYKSCIDVINSIDNKSNTFKMLLKL